MKREDLLKLMPENYKSLCWEKKAMSRHRDIQDEEMLLTLVLFYAYGHSYIDVKNYAKTDMHMCDFELG